MEEAVGRECAAAPEAGLPPMPAGLDPAELEHYEFGGKLARRLGAELSGDHDEEGRAKSEVDERDQVRMAAARPSDWKARLADMDFEARVQATLDCLGRKNNQKEILADLLNFCEQERTEQETEDFLTAHKQFADGYHSASKYLLFMQRTGAIQELEYDCDGALITDTMRDELRELGAPEDEILDLAVEWHYLTTEAGHEAARRFNPADRTRQMLAGQAASRLGSYRRLLNYCEQPRSLSEINRFMADDPGLEFDPRTGLAHMQPSAYISKLDEAGALTWENGWKTTPGGMEVLESLALDV